MHFQTLLSPLLKVPRMVLLSSLLWWELGISLSGHGPGEWLSSWHVSSKQFWFWIWFWCFFRWNLASGLRCQLCDQRENSRTDCRTYRPQDTWHKWRSPVPGHGVWMQFYGVSWSPSPAPPGISRGWTPYPTWFPTLSLSRSFWRVALSSSPSIVSYKAVSSANKRTWEQNSSTRSFM